MEWDIPWLVYAALKGTLYVQISQRDQMGDSEDQETDVTMCGDAAPLTVNVNAGRHVDHSFLETSDVSSENNEELPARIHKGDTVMSRGGDTLAKNDTVGHGAKNCVSDVPIVSGDQEEERVFSCPELKMHIDRNQDVKVEPGIQSDNHAAALVGDPIVAVKADPDSQCDNEVPSVCDVESTRRDNNTHHGDITFECPECCEQLPNKHALTLHLRDHKGKSTYPCIICGKQFASSLGTKLHLRTHIGKPFRCSCGEKFIQQCNLIAHLTKHRKAPSRKNEHRKEKPSYDCSLCEKKFSKEANLTTHLRIHYGDKPFECVVCGKQYTTKSSMVAHLRSHTGEKPYECSVCGKKYTNWSSLKYHFDRHLEGRPQGCDGDKEPHFSCPELEMHIPVNQDHSTPSKAEPDIQSDIDKPSLLSELSPAVKADLDSQCDNAAPSCVESTQQDIMDTNLNTHLAKKKYPCTICDKQLTSSSARKVHFRIHTGETPFPCTVCDKQFATNSARKLHLRIHTGETPYPCTICDKQFVSSYARKMHLRVHTGEKPYQCVVCDKRFKGKGDLNRHVLIHNEEKAFECTVCSKSFSSNNSLNMHLIVHRKPYHCTMCPKQFSTASGLNIHCAIHTGVKPFECTICGKSFAQNSRLKTHVLAMHSTERPYQCKYCGKGCISKSILERHLRIHTGEKPYQCLVCGREFALKDHLNRHLRVVHTEDKSYDCRVCGKQFPNKSHLGWHTRGHKKEAAARQTSQVPPANGVINENVTSDVPLPSPSDIVNAHHWILLHTWASYQIRKIAGCACAGNVSPAIVFKGNRQLAIPACITARASHTCRDACRDRQPAVAGKTFPAFPAHAAILRIW